MRVAYLGPEGTFSQEAALRAPGAAELELVPNATIFDTVVAVQEGTVDRAVVPIENSMEGSVSATLDTLALETDGVTIVGETVLPVHQCLISQAALPLEEIEVVISHPQANAQCARFVRSRLPQARVMTADSTADAVRLVSERIRHRWAAIGTRLAAELYGCEVLSAGIEDVAGNETRFVWLAPHGSPAGVPGQEPRGPWKTAIVFWGPGSESPGWLVRSLAELSSRGVNMTRIESRPRRQGLGRYMFFIDVEGRDTDPGVSDALTALAGHVEVLRSLGSFPAG
ncbi:MAG: prephenate dehydratase [Solirubrobacteraceae bacterium]